MRLRALLFALLVAGAAPCAAAGEREDLETLRLTTMKLIQLLVEQGVLSRDKADQLIRQAQQAAAAGGPGPAAAAPGDKPGTVRVPYVPQTVRDQMKEEIRQEVLAQARAERWGEPGALPDWVNRFTWFGDLRLRYQGDFYAANNGFYINPQATNQSGSLTLLNTTEDNTLFRVRARLGTRVRIGDGLTGEIRLTTGNLNQPLSSNQTLGNSWNRYSVAIDRAYLQYDPYEWLRFAGGRLYNPWLAAEIRSDMLWADDLGFDGFFARLRPEIAPDRHAFLTAGAFPVQNVELSSADKWLYGIQGGFDGAISPRSRAKLGIGYFYYDKIVGIQNPPGSTQFNYTAPSFLQKGNTLFNISSDPTRPLLALAADYKLFNVTGELNLPAYGDKRWLLSGDYVKNVGYDAAAVQARVGFPVSAETTGWNLIVGLGTPELRERHDWLASFGYRYVQRDATLDSFTSSDFWLGGTNTKGYTFAVNYGIDRNVWLRLRYMSGDQISGPPLGIDVLQFDVNARF
jgi:hypothetical protein